MKLLKRTPVLPFLQPWRNWSLSIRIEIITEQEIKLHDMQSFTELSCYHLNSRYLLFVPKFTKKNHGASAPYHQVQILYQESGEFSNET